MVALDEDQTFVTDGLYLFGVPEFININYLMAVLNSKLFAFSYRLLALLAYSVAHFSFLRDHQDLYRPKDSISSIEKQEERF